MNKQQMYKKQQQQQLNVTHPPFPEGIQSSDRWSS